VPFFFKHAVDALTMDPSGATPVSMMGLLALTPPTLLAGYGMARAGAAFCGEMRNLVFAKVGAGCGGGLWCDGLQWWCYLLFAGC
jgi:ATP-binding cassette subfamily B (MDR/TAP) protein 7